MENKKSASDKKPPLVVGLGEVLWDRLPGGDRLGGAPANFAFHASQLGSRAALVSAVGADEAGERLVAELSRTGINLSQLQRDDAHATGAVEITLEHGQPRYEIAADAAWDHIAWRPGLEQLARECDAVCFGTLAQRSRASRETIGRFLDATRPSAVRVFDVNLRQHFYTREILDAGLRHASVVKLNHEELRVIAGLLSFDRDDPVRYLLESFALDLVALTLGADGCELRSREQTVRAAAPQIMLADAVGAGDAFTAALIRSLLRGDSLAETAEQAVKLGAFVASQPGAMPVHAGSVRGLDNRVPDVTDGRTKMIVTSALVAHDQLKAPTVRQS